MATKDGQASTPRRHSLNDECDPNLAANEKRLVAKLDFYIIPLVMVLYLFSFLDRLACKLTHKNEYMANSHF
jgi:hypothetical protein